MTAEDYWKKQFLKVTEFWYQKEEPNMTKLMFIKAKEHDSTWSITDDQISEDELENYE